MYSRLQLGLNAANFVCVSFFFFNAASKSTGTTFLGQEMSPMAMSKSFSSRSLSREKEKEKSAKLRQRSALYYEQRVMFDQLKLQQCKDSGGTKIHAIHRYPPLFSVCLRNANRQALHCCRKASERFDGDTLHLATQTTFCAAPARAVVGLQQRSRVDVFGGNERGTEWYK